MQTYLKQIASEGDLEPNTKRQKIEKKNDKYDEVAKTSKFL